MTEAPWAICDSEDDGVVDRYVTPEEGGTALATYGMRFYLRYVPEPETVKMPILCAHCNQPIAFDREHDPHAWRHVHNESRWCALPRDPETVATPFRAEPPSGVAP